MARGKGKIELRETKGGGCTKEREDLNILKGIIDEHGNLWMEDLGNDH